IGPVRGAGQRTFERQPRPAVAHLALRSQHDLLFFRRRNPRRKDERDGDTGRRQRPEPRRRQPQSVRHWYVAGQPGWGYPAGFHRVTGGIEVTAGLLLLIPATSRAGAIGSVLIPLAALMTLLRHRDWAHLPGAVVLTAVAVAVTIRG